MSLRYHWQMDRKQSPLNIVILAAGQGTRMRSALPKVLQSLAGRPMLAHVLDLADALAAQGTVVVYGHGGDTVQAAFSDRDIGWALQAEQLGTGHAVQQAMPEIDAHSRVLILCGDVPLLRAETVNRLLRDTDEDAVGVLTVALPDPTGYGRIVRGNAGNVERIVEEKDATDAERAICEINSGVFVVPAGRLASWLEQLRPQNAQGEYYLTDIVRLAVADGVAVQGVLAGTPNEMMGINDRVQLADAERVFQRRAAETLMRAGVQLADPARIDIRGDVSCAPDSFIDVNVVLQGRVEIGTGVRIGPNCVISDSTIGDGSEILPNSVLEQAIVGAHCTIGPFARLRPGTRLADKAKVGNFVEIKKSDVGYGSKVNHLTYIGDATIGENVNVGAGTITCNYDGANKHRTVIGDNAFIGSGVELVAPVTIGAGATIGAGSTISKSAPDGSLTLERSRQRTVDGWERPVKK